MSYRINFILFFYLNIISLLSLASPDPFRQPTILSCQSLAAQLMEEIGYWRYQGIIISIPRQLQPQLQPQPQPQPQEQLQKLQDTITIWLNNKQQWLAIKWPSGNDELLPWHLTTVSTYQLHWQAQLPRYCAMTLSYTMNMAGRES